MATITKTALPMPPAPPMPSTRDLDNLATTAKQFMSLPAMGVSQMVDLFNNTNKSMLAQIQSMTQNIPAPTAFLPVPPGVNTQATASRIPPTGTAGQVFPTAETEFDKLVKESRADMR